jgi:hypothetical protein
MNILVFSKWPSEMLLHYYSVLGLAANDSIAVSINLAYPRIRLRLAVQRGTFAYAVIMH